MEEQTVFFYFAGFTAVGMLIWNTVEVGRNDAANIVNAVFGSRVMKRGQAVFIAGIAVVFGAVASSPVMETARKGIIDPGVMGVYEILCVYMAVYIAGTVILYSFSAFGMPISTTANLVFSLLGAGLAIGGPAVVHWGKSREIIMAIIFSIIFSGAIGFSVQRICRGLIGKNCEDIIKIRLFGPWVAGGLLTGLAYFMIMQGLKHVEAVELLRLSTFGQFGEPAILSLVWIITSLIAWLMLRLLKESAQKKLFAFLTVIGMIAIAVAFGQNDLANCASPGLAALMVIKHGKVAHEIALSWPILLACGFLLFLGMRTKKAQRVTRAEVNTASQGDLVRLYAPQWCLWSARLFIGQNHGNDSLAPPTITDGKTQHYDALRAAVITSVSASVIAFASGMGFPVSTTYVAFAAVVTTGWADKIFVRGDADLKLARALWVAVCWFLAAFLAALAAGACAYVIKYAGTWGITTCLLANLIFVFRIKNISDRQEERLKQEMENRRLQTVMSNATATDQDESFL